MTVLGINAKTEFTLVGSVVKNPPASVGDAGNIGLIPGSGRSPGGGNGNLLQYSCLENPTDRGAWQATVHRLAKSQRRLQQLNTHKAIMILCKNT